MMLSNRRLWFRRESSNSGDDTGANEENKDDGKQNVGLRSDLYKQQEMKQRRHQHSEAMHLLEESNRTFKSLDEDADGDFNNSVGIDDEEEVAAMVMMDDSSKEDWQTILDSVERQLADLDATSTSDNSFTLDQLLCTAAYWEKQQQREEEQLLMEQEQRRRKDQLKKQLSSVSSSAVSKANNSSSSRSLPSILEDENEDSTEGLEKLGLARENTEETEDSTYVKEVEPVGLSSLLETPQHDPWISHSMRVADGLGGDSNPPTRFHHRHSYNSNSNNTNFHHRQHTARGVYDFDDDDDHSIITATTMTTTTTAIPNFITCQASHPIQNEELLSGDPIDLIQYSCSPEQQRRISTICSSLNGPLQTHAQTFDALLTSHFEAARQHHLRKHRQRNQRLKSITTTGGSPTIATVDAEEERETAATTENDTELQEQEQALLQFIQEYPLVLQVQYHCSQLETSCWPLHYFAATNCLWLCQLAHFYFAEAIGMADTAGDLALHYACYMQADPEVIQFLLDKYPGACKKTNDLWQTPLHSILLVQVPTISEPSPEDVSSSAESSSSSSSLSAIGKPVPALSILRLLLEAYPHAIHMRDADGHTPLHLALCHKPSLEVVQLLLEEPATNRKKAKTLSEFMNSNNNAATASPMDVLQVGNGNGDWPLHVACRHGAGEDVVTWLMEQEDKPLTSVRHQNQQGFTPLHLAVSHRHWHLVRPILMINQENKQDMYPSLQTIVAYRNQQTPYHIALRKGAPVEVLELLAF